jgi:hypothetical protein
VPEKYPLTPCPYCLMPIKKSNREVLLPEKISLSLHPASSAVGSRRAGK